MLQPQVYDLMFIFTNLHFFSLARTLEYANKCMSFQNSTTKSAVDQEVDYKKRQHHRIDYKLARNGY